MKLSIETCATALNIAAMNRRSAFQTELAVGLGVFLVASGTHPDAKRLLCEAYAAAGYQCMRPADMDYKTVNRRINATAELFHHVDVKAWAGKTNEETLLRALHIGLEPFQLYTVSDVQRFCDPDRLKPPVHVKPHDAVLNGGHTGQDAVIAMFKGATAQVRAGAEHIETAHLALVIPDTTTRDELIELAAKLIALAEKKKELLTA